MSIHVADPQPLHTLSADDMARERTILAADRTLMAWIRTTLSMISFGFTIYKFLQAHVRVGEVHARVQSRGPAELRPRAHFPRRVGARDRVPAVLAGGEALRSGRRPFSLTLAVAGFVALFGILALMNMLFHIGPF